jgi:hypothetical protein
MFYILGFKVQEVRAQKEKEAGTKHSASRVVPPMDVGVSKLADKVRKKIMVLWYKQRKIGEMLDRRILPVVLHVLKAQTRGLDHLTIVQGDHYAAQVIDISTFNSRQVVKAYLHECSCDE